MSEVTINGKVLTEYEVELLVGALVVMCEVVFTQHSRGVSSEQADVISTAVAVELIGRLTGKAADDKDAQR